MDVNKALRELHEEKRRLDITIAALEARLGNGSRGRRGRKSMSAAERLEVSRRMSKYWEARRASAASLQDDAFQVESAESESQPQPKSAAAAAGSSSSLSA